MKRNFRHSTTIVVTIAIFALTAGCARFPGNPAISSVSPQTSISATSDPGPITDPELLDLPLQVLRADMLGWEGSLSARRQDEAEEAPPHLKFEEHSLGIDHRGISHEIFDITSSGTHAVSLQEPFDVGLGEIPERSAAFAAPGSEYPALIKPDPWDVYLDTDAMAINSQAGEVIAWVSLGETGNGGTDWQVWLWDGTISKKLADHTMLDSESQVLPDTLGMGTDGTVYWVVADEDGTLRYLWAQSGRMDGAEGSSGELADLRGIQNASPTFDKNPSTGSAGYVLAADPNNQAVDTTARDLGVAAVLSYAALDGASVKLTEILGIESDLFFGNHIVADSKYRGIWMHNGGFSTNPEWIIADKDVQGFDTVQTGESVQSAVLCGDALVWAEVTQEPYGGSLYIVDLGAIKGGHYRLDSETLSGNLKCTSQGILSTHIINEETAEHQFQIVDLEPLNDFR